MSREPQNQPQFAVRSRILHWLMAALLLSMLFIGITMVSSVESYHRLLSIHRPLGIAILILAIVRIVNRRLTPLPPFLETMSQRERVISSWSERLLYTLMVALPLVGWSMQSAGGYPIVMWGSFHLPPILPKSNALYTVLRDAHCVLAFTLFATFLAHLSGVLFHALVLRDGILRRMTWRRSPSQPRSEPSAGADRP